MSIKEFDSNREQEISRLMHLEKNLKLQIFVWGMSDLKTLAYSPKNDFIELKTAKISILKVIKSTFFENTIWFAVITFCFIFHLKEFTVALEKTSKLGLIFGVLSSDFFGGPSWPPRGDQILNRPFTVAV